MRRLDLHNCGTHKNYFKNMGCWGQEQDNKCFICLFPSFYKVCPNNHKTIWALSKVLKDSIRTNLLLCNDCGFVTESDEQKMRFPKCTLTCEDKNTLVRFKNFCSFHIYCVLDVMLLLKMDFNVMKRNVYSEYV